MQTIQRIAYQQLVKRLQEPRRFLQILAGPRQVGKTTLVQQALAALTLPNHYASADEPYPKEHTWLEQQWETGRLRAQQNSQGALLALDEIQKIPHWSTVVKRLWDEDTRQCTPLKVILLGSAPLLMQQGLTESLAGRFEVIPITHWSYQEMQQAFGYNLDQYIYFGGYPGAASLAADEERWRHYIRDSLIETSISRDILLMVRVDKPALLRQLFYLGSNYSGQIISYQKLLGQLHDAGNTTTLAHYLELLTGAGMLTGLSKFSGKMVRQRASSPKLQVLNTALMSAVMHTTLHDTRQDSVIWGRLVESAVGAHLINQAVNKSISIYYWREGNYEVDFVLQKGKTVIALEVKSGRKKTSLSGSKVFAEKFKPKKLWLIGEQGLPLQDFFNITLETLF